MSCIVCSLTFQLCWVSTYLDKCHWTDGWNPPVQSWLQTSTATGAAQSIFRLPVTLAGWGQPGSGQRLGQGCRLGAVSSCWWQFRPHATTSASTSAQFWSPAKICTLLCCHLHKSLHWSVCSICCDWTRQESVGSRERKNGGRDRRVEATALYAGSTLTQQWRAKISKQTKPKQEIEQNTAQLIRIIEL